MSTPIAARGEAEIKIGPRTLRLKASYASLCAIEEALDASVLLLALRVQKGDIRIQDTAIMLSALAEGGGEKLSVDEAGPLLFEDGYLKHLPTLSKVLSDAIKAGHEEHEADSVPNVPKAES